MLTGSVITYDGVLGVSVVHAEIYMVAPGYPLTIYRLLVWSRYYPPLVRTSTRTKADTNGLVWCLCCAGQGQAARRSCGCGLYSIAGGPVPRGVALARRRVCA
jgi:hypothetical protein